LFWFCSAFPVGDPRFSVALEGHKGGLSGKRGSFDVSAAVLVLHSATPTGNLAFVLPCVFVSNSRPLGSAFGLSPVLVFVSRGQWASWGFWFLECSTGTERADLKMHWKFAVLSTAEGQWANRTAGCRLLWLGLGA